MWLSPKALLSALAVALTACGEALVPIDAIDTVAPPTEIAVSVSVEGLVNRGGESWVGPAGLQLQVAPTGPVSNVALIVRDGRGDREVDADTQAPWRLALDPAAAELVDHQRARLVVRGRADDGAEAETSPLEIIADLSAPTVSKTTPELPASGPRRDAVSFHLDDGDGVGVDAIASAVDVDWRGPDGTSHALTEGTDFIRAADGEDELTLTIMSPSEGRYTFAVAPVDLLGSAGEPALVTYTADETPPVLTLEAPTDGDAVSGAFPVEAWAADALLPGTVVLSASLTDGDGALAETSAGPLEIDTSPLSDGPGELTVRAEDAAGNVATESRALVVDNAPPRVAIVSPGPGTWVRGPLAVTVTATDDGVGLDRIAARLDDRAEPVASTPADDLGVYTLAAALPEGEHMVWVDAFDRLGHVATTSVLVAADLTPPQVTFNPSASAQPTQALPQWTVVATDGGVGVDLAATAASIRLRAADERAYDVAVDEAQGALLVTAGDVPSGDYRMEVVAVDALGNQAESASGAWEIDRDAPAIDFLGPARVVWSRAVDVQWTVTEADAVASSWLDLEDATEQLVTLPGLGPPWHAALDSTALADGLALATIAATDRAGNVATNSAWVVVDNTAPTIVIASPTDGRHAPVSLVVNAVAHEGTSGVASCDVRVDGGEPLASKTFESAPTGAVPCPLPVTVAIEGLHTLTVRAVDAGGLVGEASAAVWIDDAVPSAIVAPAGGLVTALPPVTFTISDAGEASDAGPDLAASAETVSVTVDGAPVDGWSTSTDVSTRGVTVTWPKDAPDGVWRVALSPLDGVGNVGEEVPASFVLDTSPPELANPSPAPDTVASGVLPVALEITDASPIMRVAVALIDSHGGTLAAPFEDDGHWHASLGTEALEDGPATVILSADDSVGHTGTLAIPIVIDNRPPTVLVTAPEGDTLLAGDFDLVASLRDDGVGVTAVAVQATDDALLAEATFDEALHAGPVTLPLHLDTGAYTLDVTARDALGRMTVVSHDVAVDATPPTLTAEPGDGATLGKVLALSLTLSDGGGPFAAGVDAPATAATLAVTRAGLPYTSYAVSVEGDRVEIVLTEGRTGVLEVNVTPTDLLQNAAEPVDLTYTVDRRAPSVAFHMPPSDATDVDPTTTLSISFDEDMAPLSLLGALRVTADGTAVDGTSTVDPSHRSIRFTPSYPFGPLAHVEVLLSGTVTDVSGNALGPDFAFEVTVAAYRFRDIADESGLGAYSGGTGERGEDHGPGGTFTDLTDDGYPELVLATADGQPLRYFVNVPDPEAPTGRRFEEAPLVPDQRPASTGIVAGDFDNDGDLDLYVTNFHEPNLLLANQLAETGSADFVDVTAATVPAGDDPTQLGVGTALWPGHKELTLSMTAAWADVNRDGWLDLYVGSHNGHYPIADDGVLPGERDTLYLNLGDGTFEDVTDAAHAQGWEAADGSFVTSIQEYSSTDAVIFADLNDDRWPDLIVTNKLRHPDDRDMIYLNRGADADGAWLGFHPISYELNPPFGDTNSLAMGIVAGDVDRDGDLDFYVTDWGPYGMVPGPNELWINTHADTGEVRFEVADYCTGVYSWGSQIVDLDNDGLLDIHVATNGGYPDLLYHQDPEGGGSAASWLNVASAWGVAQNGNSRGNSRGDMSADVDRDGWMDLFVVTSGLAPRLLRNFSAELVGNRHWLGVRVVGAPELSGPYRSTRDAIGARVHVSGDFDGDGVEDQQLQEVLSGGSNAASTSSLDAEFGLGLASAVDVEVVWPSGRVTTLTEVPADQHLVVREADQAP